MTPSITTQITKTVQLAPQVRRKLLTELKGYTALKAQIAALEAQLADRKAGVEALVLESGETSLTIEEFKATLVTPITKRLNPQRLVALGVSTETIQKATEEKLGRTYVKISVSGAKGDEHDE